MKLPLPVLGLALACVAARSPARRPRRRPNSSWKPRRHDDAAIARLRAELARSLGATAGVPEGGLRKAEPIDPGPPDPALVPARWAETLAAAKGRLPWEAATETRRPRTRAVGRWVRALWLADAAGAGDGREAARAGADFLLSVQGDNGVFGYPVPPPESADRLAAAARRAVAEMERQGVKGVERGYIVEALGRGDLNFDNGEAAVALLTGYAAKGEKKWLDAAKRHRRLGPAPAARGQLELQLLPRRAGGPALPHHGRGALPGRRRRSHPLRHAPRPNGRRQLARPAQRLAAVPGGDGPRLRRAAPGPQGPPHPFAAELERRTRSALDSLAGHTLEWGFTAAKYWEARWTWTPSAWR